MVPVSKFGSIPTESERLPKDDPTLVTVTDFLAQTGTKYAADELKVSDLKKFRDQRIADLGLKTASAKKKAKTIEGRLSEDAAGIMKKPAAAPKSPVDATTAPKKRPAAASTSPTPETGVVEKPMSPAKVPKKVTTKLAAPSQDVDFDVEPPPAVDSLKYLEIFFNGSQSSS